MGITQKYLDKRMRLQVELDQRLKDLYEDYARRAMALDEALEKDLAAVGEYPEAWEVAFARLDAWMARLK